MLRLIEINMGNGYVEVILSYEKMLHIATLRMEVDLQQHEGRTQSQSSPQASPASGS